MSAKKLTIKDLKQLKGTRKFTEIFTTSPDEAAAAEAAGVDMICAAGDLRTLRAAAPNTFMIGGIPFEAAESEALAIKHGAAVLAQGMDAIYTGVSVERVAAMTREFIPIIGHVGMVPYRNSWYGGIKAVGKTAEDAKAVYDLTKQYDDAGAIGVEMELVPRQVAAIITKSVKLLTLSMGAGPECDVQYLFSCDILGTNTDHVPRHAKVYANLAAEYERIRGLMTDAYRAFDQEVKSGAFPESNNNLSIPDDELAAFKSLIG